MNQLPAIPAPQIARPVMNPGARGFRVDFGEVAAAQQMPQINARGFVAEAAAIGEVGRGLEGIGEGLAEMARLTFESYNRRKIDEADSFTAAADVEIAKQMADEPDEKKWVDIFEKESAKWTQEALKDKSLSPVARQAIESKMRAWQTSTRRNVGRSAVEQSHRKELEGLEGLRITAVNSGNWQAAEAATAEQESRGLIGKDTAARQRIATEQSRKAKEQEARQNEVIAVTRTEGREAARARVESMDIEPVEKERLLSDVNQIHRGQVAEDADLLANDIADGKIRTPEEVDAYAAENPRISPELRERYKAFVRQKNDAIEVERQRANAPENQSRLLSEIADLDPEKATDEDFLKIDLAIKQLPEGWRDVPYRRLHRKWRKLEGEEDVSDMSGLGDDLLHSMLNGGSFGAFDFSKTIKDKDGKDMVDEKTGEKKLEWYRDPARYRDALIKKADVGGKFARWLKANPKATPEQVQKRIYELTGEPVAAGLLDDIFGSPAGPPGNMGGNVDVLGDMPSRPAGPPENTLLPPLPQQ